MQKFSNYGMYLTTLPDHSSPGFDEKRHFSMFGNANIIFNAVSSKSGCDNHVGCLSIKTVSMGEEWYGINGTQVAVRPGTFLLLNDGQDYSCRIDTTQVRTVSVFFARDFARAALRDSINDDETLIDDPFEDGRVLPEFFQTLHPLDTDVRHDLSSLIRSVELHGYHRNMADEHLVSLLYDLLRIHKTDITASKNIHGIRASTRKEIYRRVSVARDFLHSFYREDRSLKSIAAASSLSVPQLVRQFKAAFGVTPHRYLLNIRLQHAADLLQSADMPIAEVASHCGFDDASAFSRAFKSKYKKQPTQFRFKAARL